jgi:hypothetical protein
VRSDPRWFRGYLIATTALFFGLGIVGAFVTLGVEDSIGGRIISGVMTVALFSLKGSTTPPSADRLILECS